MKFVLVTGSEGFIGKALCVKLLSDGISMTCFDKTIGGDVCELRKLSEVMEAQNPDCVFHLSGITSTQAAAAANPVECHLVNVVGTLNILISSRHRRVVIADTYLPPTDTYSISKAAARMLVTDFQNRGFNCCLFKQCNVFGPGDGNLKRIIPSTITSILSGRRPIVRSNQRKPFAYIDDIVNDYIHLSGQSSREHSATGCTLSVLDLVRLILELMESDLEPDVQCDAEAPLELINADPKFKQCLRETINWYTNNKC